MQKTDHNAASGPQLPPGAPGGLALRTAPVLTPQRLEDVCRHFADAPEGRELADALALNLLGWARGVNGRYINEAGKDTGYCPSDSEEARRPGSLCRIWTPLRLERDLKLVDNAILRCLRFPDFVTILSKLTGINIDNGRYTRLKMSSMKQRAQAAWLLVARFDDGNASA